MATDHWLAIDCCGQRLWLHHQRAVFWPAAATLLLADTHFGKEHRFARAGIAIPEGPSHEDLARISSLVRSCSAAQLIVLGDLMHSAPESSETWLAGLSGFLDKHAELSMQVVAGNHDDPRAQSYIDERIVWHRQCLHLDPFVLQHEPAASADGYVLSGHLHPVFRLSASGDTLRTPAFWFGEHHAVLPSFGQFTGGHAIRPGSSDRIFLAGPDNIVPIPPASGKSITTGLAEETDPT